MAYLLLMHRLHRLSDDEAGELRRWLDESPRHEAWMKKALDAERMARSRSVAVCLTRNVRGSGLPSA